MFVPFTSGQTRYRRHNAFTPVNAVLSATLQSIADAILHPVIVLAAVTFLLGGSPYMIAAFTAITVLAWTATALSSPLLLAFPRPYVFVVAASVVRLLAIVSLAITAFRSPQGDPSVTLRVLLIAYAIYAATSAIISHVSIDIVAGESLTPRRATLFPQRAALGAAAAVLGGAVAWSVGRSVSDIRDAMGALFLFAAICTAAATWFLLAVPPGRRNRAHPFDASGRSFGFLRPLASGAFRRFIAFRLATGLSAAADPFIIVLGFREGGLGLRHIGLAVAAWAAGHLIGQLWWPSWSARRSPRSPLQIAALLRTVALVVALGVPALASSGVWTDRVTDPAIGKLLFLIAFALLGLAISAQALANQRYLIDTVAPGTLSRAVTATNLVHVILGLGPFLAAYLIRRTSLDGMLWAAIAAAFIALLFSGTLTDSRVEIGRPLRFRIGPQRLGAR